MADEISNKTRPTVGGGLTLVSTLGPTLGFPLPFWLRWALFAVGVIMLFWPVIQGAAKRARKMDIEATHLIIIGLAGVICFAALALGGVVWQSRSLTPDDELTIVDLKSKLDAANKKLASAPQATPSQQPPQQAAPVGDSGPPVPKDQLQLTARLIQLTSLIKQAKDARELARASGAAGYERMLQNIVNDPNYQKPPLGLIGSWPEALRHLRRINTLFDRNRKMDLETFREMNNALYKAPRQDVFGDDGERASQYHSSYFLTKHVLTQAETLIGQMEDEAKNLRSIITNSAALSALDEPK
jgi:hypothetical protein